MKNSLLIMLLAAFVVIPVINAQINDATEIERANQRIETHNTMPAEGAVYEDEIVEDEIVDDSITEEEIDEQINDEEYDYGFIEEEYPLDDESYDSDDEYRSFGERPEQLDNPDYYQYPDASEF